MHECFSLRPVLQPEVNDGGLQAGGGWLITTPVLLGHGPESENGADKPGRVPETLVSSR